MEYQVPQFIEIEDKIFGPLTLKQFIYLVGGGGLVVISFVFLPLVFAILVSIPAGGLALALAFFKMNGKSFVEILEYGIQYYLGKRLYLWRKEKVPLKAEVAPTATPTLAASPKDLNRRKLEELAFALDVRSGNDQTIT